MTNSKYNIPKCIVHYITTLLLLFIFHESALAQQPDTPAVKDSSQIIKQNPKKIYHVNHVLIWTYNGVASVANYFSIARLKGKPDYTDAEIAALRPDLINPIDRWALQQNPGNRKTFSFYSDSWQAPIFLLPGLLAFNQRIKDSHSNWDLLTMYMEGHTITFTFYNFSWLGPTFQDKPRPLTYYTNLPLKDRESGQNKSSFYSGHTASVAYATFFMAKVFNDYHPELTGGQRFLIYTAATIPPIIEGYLRIVSLAHFPSDVMTGFALGTTIGIVIPELHKFHPRNLSFGLIPVSGGMGFSMNYMPGAKRSY